MLFRESLETRANTFPNREALACQAQGVTMGIIEAHANSLRNALIDEGLRQQDRAAVCLGNSVDSLISVFGALGPFTVSQRSESCGKLPGTSACESKDGA